MTFVSPKAVTWLAFLVLFGFYAALGQFYSVNLLTQDPWDYLRPVFEGKGFWDLFSWQHGPHRMGIGIFLIQGFYELTGWSLFAEAFFAMALIALLSIGFYLFKIRITGRYSYYDLLFPIVGLSFLEFENSIGTNLSHGIIPLLMICVYCHIFISNLRPWLRAALFSLLLFNITYAGFGFFWTLILIPLHLFLGFKSGTDRYSNWLTAAAGIATLLLFFKVNYRHDPALECYTFPHHKPIEYLYFVSTAYGKLLGFYNGIFQAIAVIPFLGLVFIGLRQIKSFRMFWKNTADKSPLYLLGCLVAFSVAFLAAAAIGRVCAGVGMARQSRYILYLLPSLYAFYIFLALAAPQFVQLSQRFKQALAILVAILFINAEIAHWSREFPDIRQASLQKQKWREIYLKTGDYALANAAAGAVVYPDTNLPRFRKEMDFLRSKKVNLFKP